MEYAQLKPGRRFAPVRSLLYFSQRLVTQPALRRLVVHTLTGALRLRHGSGTELHGGHAEEAAALGALRRNGYAPLGKLLSSEQCAAIRTYLQDKLLTDRDRERTPFVLAHAPHGVRVADYHLRDVVACPHILALANGTPLLGLAARYLGCKPTISALGLRWSFPVAGRDSDLQAFHRDAEDWRYLKVLAYLTDVDLDAGPHVFLSGSHLAPAPARLRYYSDAAVADIAAHHGAAPLLTATGPHGFCFAVDTAGIHKGTAPRVLPRLMLQIQYSLLPAYAYCYAPETYDGALPLDPYVNRLIVRQRR
ncbi:hypothetical protein ASF61_22055 [Duganella sp. Leaf126]|uniref:phytanoyl-CoA dioxygenase family protein n=1 Tax=Duganella sp. Leaf126 TaxID=1736266 RepID=UPI0006F4F678|nr:phytanoyl-CoA dioxygenase family protein [Duganella sp. Leaf126]KQQ42429.1 hypothetical protein ASF61_22055 [Duganella sp. Leaf126]